jgi:glycine reductase
MRLERALFPVHEARLSGTTRWDAGLLEVDAVALEELLRQDPVVAGVRLGIGRPGASQRIIHVLDTLEPRCKVEGPGTAFPGLLGPPETVGRGRTHVLAGMAVMTAAELPWPPGGGLRAPREGIVDMSGPAAPLSPFAATWNLVLGLDLAPDRDDAEYDEAVRRAGLRAAHYLAACTRGLDAPQVVAHELGPCPPDLPRVVYIDQVQSQGTFGHTLLYGRDMDNLVPTLIHPNELLDGAVVSSNYLYSCFKTPTYLRCNLPAAELLGAGHGRDHNFLGVLLSRGHYYTYEEKMRVAQYAANLAGLLDADGALLTWEGGGNSVVEAMLTIQALEQAGIPTVAVAYELGGAEGRDAPLIQSVPEARGLVSTGSYEKPIRLPAVQEVLGGDTLRLHPELGGQRVPAADAIELQPMHELYCVANQTGFGRLQAVDF